MDQIEKLIKQLETLTGKKIILNEEAIEESFAVQIPSPKKGIDPAF